MRDFCRTIRPVDAIVTVTAADAIVTVTPMPADHFPV